MEETSRPPCDPCARMSSSPPWESFMTSGRLRGTNTVGPRVNKRLVVVLNAFNDAYSRMNGCTYWFSSHFLTLQLKTGGLRTYLGMLCTQGKILPACFDDLASTGMPCRQQWLSSICWLFWIREAGAAAQALLPWGRPRWLGLHPSRSATSILGATALPCVIFCFDRPFPNQASVLLRNWPKVTASSCCRCSICRSRCSCTDHQEGKDIFM